MVRVDAITSYKYLKERGYADDIIFDVIAEYCTRHGLPTRTDIVKEYIADIIKEG